MLQMWSKLIYRLRRLFYWLWLQEGEPGYKARGLAIGVFCGCFPLFGFQTLLGIALAGLLRGNYLLAVSGTWVSNPLTYIPLYLFNYRVGSSLLGNAISLQDLSEFTLLEIWSKGWIVTSRLLLGCTLVGITLSILVGFIGYFFLKLRS